MSDPRPSLSSQFCRRQFSLGLACAIGGIGAGFIPTSAHAVLDTLKPISMPSPKTPFADDSGAEVSLDHWHGAPVLVNFWATWCPPCRREMGSLEKLHQATKDKNVEILAVDIGEDLDTVFSFLGLVEPSPTFQMLFDFDAVSMKKWNVRGLPTTYIIKPDGTIAYKAVGGREFDHPSIIKAVTELGSK